MAASVLRSSMLEHAFILPQVANHPSTAEKQRCGGPGQRRPPEALMVWAFGQPLMQAGATWWSTRLQTEGVCGSWYRSTIA